MEELQNERRLLLRNIARTKEVIADKKEKVKAKERKQQLVAQGGRVSEADSNSMKDADQHSYASLSALGGYTSQRVDVKKV